MKLYIIHNADLRTDKNNVVAQSCVATKDHPHPEAIWYTMPVISVLIEHPNLKIEGVDGDREILPGIRLRKLPGHTAGLMGLQVTLPKTGTLLFTSDAAYCRENYGPPAKTPANCYDTLSYRDSIEKIREIAEQGVKIVWGHDEALASEFHYLPEYYE